MKKSKRTLALSKTTITRLGAAEMANVRGAGDETKYAGCAGSRAGCSEANCSVVCVAGGGLVVKPIGAVQVPTPRPLPDPFPTWRF